MLSGQMFTLTFQDETILNADGDIDVWEVIPATDRPIWIAGFVLSQNEELGDAAEEQLRWSIIRGFTTSSNGTSTTARPVGDSAITSAFTAERLGEIVAVTGTPHFGHSDGWNVRQPLLWLPPENMWIKCDAGDNRIVVRIEEAVADDISGVNSTLYVWEV